MAVEEKKEQTGTKSPDTEDTYRIGIPEDTRGDDQPKDEPPPGPGERQRD